ncbi:MAG TPA: peptidoglycan-binding protein [Candidatus Limivivens intestinipullorum]|uniref:Peptidoglycan-binding protein n=1 Tax=Candidatus Limivivens intestinipullorum TaxID=2840858 RepID=A0A9D1JIL7_9FIRM|nr:peptidoglycan-binding protein [Candidatus Limivivens intestinipullorum]
MILKPYRIQQDTPDKGFLQITVESQGRLSPVPGARVTVFYTGDPDSVITEMTTDGNGRLPELELDTPPLEYSLTPGSNQPYAEYTIQVSADGYETTTVSGTEVLPDSLALQTINLRPLTSDETYDNIVIPAHTLYGDYPPKIAESETKPGFDSGEIVLSRVVIPEFVVVHDGVPTDTSAGNYYVRYRDYIKNVASSEIYATWPRATIEANVLAIMSFTLNRVYTEWYRNKGYDFTITSSTAFDQKWIYGRNIFESISEVVDELFELYLSRPNVRQPILTQYCDGKRVSCPNWLSQWGSKSLGEQGYTPIEIIRYYYGDNMYINNAEQISGIPASWPGYDLTYGATGQKVEQLQEQLNAISEGFPLIPKVTVDGIYGPRTAESVSVFQNVFGLPETGSVDYRTWYKIQEIYVGVTRIAELYP